MLDFKDLETLIYLSKLQSFVATADKLYTTQSNISKRLAKMESNLGKVLFIRKGKTVRLTHDGEHLLEHAVRLISQRDQMLTEITDKRILKGNLRIGVSESVVFLLLPEVLGEFQKIYPQVRLDLQVDISSKLKQFLMRDEVDLALLIGGVNDAGYRDRSLTDYPMGFFVHRDLNVPECLEEALKMHPLITFTKDTLPYLNLIKKIKNVGDYRVHNCSSLSALVNMTFNKNGIGVFPEEIALRRPWKGQFKKMKGVPLEPLRYFASMEKTNTKSYITDFMKIAVNACSKKSSPTSAIT